MIFKDLSVGHEKINIGTKGLFSNFYGSFTPSFILPSPFRGDIPHEFIDADDSFGRIGLRRFYLETSGGHFNIVYLETSGGHFNIIIGRKIFLK